MDEQAQPAAAGRGAALPLLLPLAVAIVAFAVYARTLGFDFVYDDYAQIVETKQLNSPRMIPRYFTGHVWSWKTPGIPGPYYRPVFLLWLLLNQLLFGAAPEWWHLTSVLTHVAVTLLVYALARRLTGDVGAAAMAALLFAVHPVHVEDVAWVSCITEPLVAFFLLAAFLCHLKRSKSWRAASLALFIAALLEKETAVVLTPLVFAYEWLYSAAPGDHFFANWRARLRRALALSLPFLAATLVYLGVRYQVMHGFVLVITPLPLRQMIYTWPAILVFYLRHLVWPFGLNVFYMLRVVEQPDMRNFGAYAALLAAVAAGLVLWARRSRTAAFAAVWMILPLLPVLNLRVFAHNETVHDRYLYVPSIGFCILAALALRRMGKALRQPLAAAGIAIPIAAIFAYSAVEQERHWANNLALFEHAVAVAPDNEIANQGMGTSLMLRGLIAEAIPYYRRALQLQPEMFESAYSLGRCYYEVGEFAEAEPFLMNAANMKPWDPKPLLYYGLAELKQGRLDTAEQAIRRAIRIKGPDDYREYHLSLGLVLEASNDHSGALREFQAEAAENPDPSKALEQIAELKAKMAGRE